MLLPRGRAQDWRREDGRHAELHLDDEDAGSATVSAASFDDCAGAEMVQLPVGAYSYVFTVSASGALAESDL